MSYLLSSNNNDTPNLKKTSPNTLPSIKSEPTTEETNEAYDPTSKPGKDAEIKRGSHTDELSEE